MEFLTPHHIRDLGLEPLPIRPDAAVKLGGNPGFLSDRIQPGQLRGAILGSPHPHARILRIDTSAAKALAGVHAVVTHADIPGFKYYGLRKVDRPVLCIDKVRHEVAAWQRLRDQINAKVDWQFTCVDARIKLKRLYPTFDC